MAQITAIDALEVEAHNLAEQARRLADFLDVRARGLAEKAHRYRILADSIAEDERVDAFSDNLLQSATIDVAPRIKGRGATQICAVAGREGKPHSRPSGARGKAPRLEVLRTLSETKRDLSIAEISVDVRRRLPETSHETIRITVYNLKRSGYVVGKNALFHIAERGRAELRAA